MPSSRKTDLNTRAYIYHTTALYILKYKKMNRKSMKKIGLSIFSEHNFGDNIADVDYLSFDVCNSTSMVTQLAINFLLNKKNVGSDITTNIAIITAYLPVHLMRLLARLLSCSNIPLLYLNPDTENPIVYEFNNFIIEVDPMTSAKYLYRKLQKFGWNYQAIVFFYSGELTSQSSYFEAFKKLYSAQQRTCYMIMSVNITNDIEFRRAAGTIRNDTNLKVITLIGEKSSQVTFITAIGVNSSFAQRLWVIHDPNSFLYDSMFQAVVVVKDFKVEFTSQLERYLFLFPKFNHFFQTNSYFRYTKAHEIAYTESINTVEYINQVLMMAFYSSPSASFLRRKLDRSPYIDIKNSGKSKKFPFPKHMQSKTFSVCPIKICKPGWQKVFGPIYKNQNEINESLYGWNCVRCPTNYFKPQCGDYPCQPCTGINLVNKDQSICYDPYKCKFLDFSSMLIKICVAGSVIGTLLTIIVLIVFIKFRNTPVAKASDIKLSILHLSTTLIIFGVLPFLFMGEPNKLRCSVQPICIGLLYTLSLALIFIKSRKIIRTFKLKYKLTEQEIMFNSIRDVSTGFGILLLSGLLLIFSLIEVPVDVMERLQQKFYKRIVYCNTGFHIQIQVGYMMVLLFASPHQAIRGRKLPVLFNDAMVIVYATFTNTIMFCIMFPIYYFQDKDLDKVKVNLVFLMCNNFLFLFFVYGGKVYIMLFCPERNSVVYIRKKILSVCHQKARGLRTGKQ